ncbi:hypothetical protein B0T10DRAFT_607723 [Thelonectria olida]|uniref:Rhodopsin domain-containing protein n=1 Tax=Thelonectria olida TaxID=1576542 RepID=A0A9P9AMQ6_9HYPO|nr:hypothetical protein B0T10DRAFT_607723 [Thelonectria olida]
MSSTQKVITDSNKSPLVQVLTLMFLVVAILACLVRTGTKIYMIKALRVDDLLVIAATVLAIGQSIAVFVGCDNGLGKHSNTLSSSTTDAFFKSQYSANALFIASLFCSKLSGTMTLRIMSQKNQKWIILCCEVVVGLWGLTGLIVNLFQCRLPSPWSYAATDQCINQTIFWTYYSIANIVTDIAIVIIMGENVLKIQTSLSKKILVMSVFGSRILVTPAIAVQIYYSNMAFASTDFSFSIWQAAIAIQLVQCLAIVTVCVPNLKPFLDSLESGQIRVDDLRRQGKSSSNGYPSNRLGYAGYKSGQSSRLASRSRSRPFESVDGATTTDSQLSNVHELVDFSKFKKQGSGKTTEEEQGTAWDRQSRASHSSQTILIHQTWQVDVENMNERGLRQN